MVLTICSRTENSVLVKMLRLVHVGQQCPQIRSLACHVTDVVVSVAILNNTSNV